MSPSDVGTEKVVPRAGGTQLWAARSGSGNGDNRLFSLAASPDGARVFVTGYASGAGTDIDYGTVAYDGSTGDELWSRLYDGPGHGFDQATSVKVSPDGAEVFVTGFSTGSDQRYDYATVAYDAVTGQRLWASRYDGPEHYYDYAFALALSPDGTRVFVTGYVSSFGKGDNYATVAYDASSGTQLWESRYSGPGNGTDEALAVAASPDGTMVFVTGYSYFPNTHFDDVTIAYDAVTGQRLWASRYNGPGGDGDAPTGLAVSPDGTKVFLTGHSWGSAAEADYATIAYEASTGARLWVVHYNGPGDANDIAYSLGVSPDGSKVFVTGSSIGAGTGYDFATVAYDASTGGQLWARRYNGPRNDGDEAFALGVSPDGTKVFVTGHSRGLGSGVDYATIAYDASSGAMLWASRYNGPGNSYDFPTSLGVSPGTSIFVGGYSKDEASRYDYATIAYSVS